jgi:hypothetical protein
MKRKPAWYLVGVLVIGLALLAFSCGGTTPAEEEEEEVVTEEEEEEVMEEEEEEVMEEEEEEVVGPAPAIAHVLSGRDNCLACHETGVAGADKIPAGHSGYSNAACAGCHMAPTAMAHAPDAMGDDCVMCHVVGGGGVGETGGTGTADTHEGRTSDICLDCHEE